MKPGSAAWRTRGQVQDTPHPHVRPGAFAPVLALLAVVSVLAFGGSRSAWQQGPGCGHDKFAPARPGVPAALHVPVALEKEHTGAPTSSSVHARPCPPSSADIRRAPPLVGARLASAIQRPPADERPPCVATGPPAPPPRRS